MVAQTGAMANDHLQVLEYLYEHCNEGCRDHSVTDAVKNGHLDSIKFAHEHEFDGFTHRAMHKAATSGHLDIVKFLHENRTEGCYENTAQKAQRRGHRDVVKFFCRYHPMKSPREAMKSALEEGEFGLFGRILRGAIVPGRKKYKHAGPPPLRCF